MVELDVMKGSYSKLQLFERCQRAFYFKYVKNMEYTTPAMEFGKIIHEELAKFLTTGAEGKTLNSSLPQKSDVMLVLILNMLSWNSNLIYHLEQNTPL